MLLNKNYIRALFRLGFTLPLSVIRSFYRSEAVMNIFTRMTGI